jgi:hypothetical protein
LRQVDLQPDKEHQQQLAEVREKIGDLIVLWDNPQNMRTNQDADQDEAHARRQPA